MKEKATGFLVVLLAVLVTVNTVLLIWVQVQHRQATRDLVLCESELGGAIAIYQDCEEAGK